MDRELEKIVILAKARIALNATETAQLELSIEDGRIRFGTHNGRGPVMDLEGFLILPGLINAHDHLEFNLFPRLGRGSYVNATEWAEDIYRPHEPPVCEQLRIPKSLRLVWGGIKNLISGVTSVLHHNPYEAAVFEQGFPVRVIKAFGWAHSLRFGGCLQSAFASTPPGAPFVIHACEGIDATSAREVYQLDTECMLGPRTVLVHGVALDREGVALLKRRGASLIWCPSSNYFMLGRSLSRQVLDSDIPIALGTDSALTGAGDLIDEITQASIEIGAKRIYRMVTNIAAHVLRLDSGEGEICEGGIADLIVLHDRGQSPAEALNQLRPEVVIIGGRIKLISLPLAERFAPLLREGFQPIAVAGRGRYLIDCSSAGLFQCVEPILGERFRLAGKEVFR